MRKLAFILTLLLISLHLYCADVAVEGPDGPQYTPLPSQISDSILSSLGLDSFRLYLFRNTDTTIMVKNLKDRIVNTDLNLENKVIPYRLDISDAIFNGDINVISTHFKERVTFINTKFKGPVIFYNSGFDDLTRFSWSHFYNQVSFVGNTFNEYFSFYEDTFELGADFARSTFNSNGSFDGAYFKSTAVFGEVEFVGKIDYSNTVFTDYLIFREAQFYSSPKFYKTELPKVTDLINAEIDRELDFTFILNTAFDTSRIQYYGADINRIRLNYPNLRVGYHTSLNNDQISNLYHGLLAKLKRDGSTESYKELDLEYQDFYYHKVKTNRLYKLAYWLQKKWWNFGYEKELIFFHSVWMFLLASFFIQGFFKHFVNDVYRIENISEAYVFDTKRSWRETWRNIRLTYFYTAIIFFGLKMKIENLNFSNTSGVTYIFLIYTVGLICTAFIFNYFISI